MAFRFNPDPPFPGIQDVTEASRRRAQGFQAAGQVAGAARVQSAAQAAAEAPLAQTAQGVPGGLQVAQAEPGALSRPPEQVERVEFQAQNISERIAEMEPLQKAIIGSIFEIDVNAFETPEERHQREAMEQLQKEQGPPCGC